MVVNQHWEQPQPTARECTQTWEQHDRCHRRCVTSWSGHHAGSESEQARYRCQLSALSASSSCISCVKFDGHLTMSLWQH